MSREAMKQPEALRLADALDAEFVQGRISNSTGRESAVELRRLHEALETEQEPVAWRFRSGTWFNREVQWRYIDTLDGADGLRGLQPLYTAPPKKQWFGLTDEEHDSIKRNYHDMTWTLEMFARAIEAKLKEKNT